MHLILKIEENNPIYGISGRIKQAKNETEGISRRKEETSASVEQEKERLHKIYRGLEQSVSRVSLEQIERIVESKSA